MNTYDITLKKIAHEPKWVAIALLTGIALFLGAGLYISGIFGIIVALMPLLLLLAVLCLINPYPFWLFFFFLAPLSYIVQDIFPTGSFIRFLGLVLVAFSVPSILMSKRSANFKMTPLGASLLLFFLGCSISLLAFVDLEESFSGLELFFGNILSYWVFINIFKKEKKLESLLNVLIAAVSIQALIAVVQKLIHPLWRSAGTITDPNYFGFWLLPFICFAFYLGVAERNSLKKVLYFSAYAIMSIAIPLTYSRSMIIVLVIAQFVLFWRQKKLLLFGVFILATGALLVIGFPNLFAQGISISSFFTAARVASIDWRWYFAQTAVKMFLEHPLFGIGVDAFFSTFQFYSATTPTIRIAVVHDSFLEILSGTGLVGSVPFAFILFFSVRNFWQARKRQKQRMDKNRRLLAEGLLVGFLISLLSHFFLSTQHHVTLWLFIAFSTIVLNQSLSHDKQNSLQTD